MAQRIDHDSPWKEILRQYFPEAIQFFFPNTASLVDWQRPIEFLDKEFQQIAVDAAIGKRFADQLVKVWLQGGHSVWLLVHLEVQGSPEPDFAERMFTCHIRIFERFHQHPASLAILCDSRLQWRPMLYHHGFAGTQLNFQFEVAKLMDYQEQLAALEQSFNPFAVVVLAHLQAQQAKNPLELKGVKFNLLRSLYERGFTRSQITNLFRFIDWTMMLPESLERQFWQELRLFEQELSMPYVTSVERIGRQEGRQEEAYALVMRLLARKLKSVPESASNAIQQLPTDTLEALAEALLDFSTLSDLEIWLQEN
ncbi:MAG: DUF4351 domain-containing protein [Cyanobacteria bacterium P01_H01_bin.121]